MGSTARSPSGGRASGGRAVGPCGSRVDRFARADDRGAGVLVHAVRFADLDLVESGARERRIRRDRDPRNAPRAPARRRRDHPRAQTDRLVSHTVQLHDPQTLYRHWENEQWNPWKIDLVADCEQWQHALADRDKGLVYWALSSLMVAEERITTKFAGLVM